MTDYHSSIIDTVNLLIQHPCSALWARIIKNPDVSTGPLAHPFACSLALLTHLLVLHCSLRLRALLRSLVYSLAYFAHYLARGKVNN